MTALMVTARAGSAVTAEIGIMRITEQIDALEVMGLSPYRYLIVPNFLAAVISVPLLTAIFNVIGVLGGYLVGVKLLGVSRDLLWGDVGLRHGQGRHGRVVQVHQLRRSDRVGLLLQGILRRIWGRRREPGNDASGRAVVGPDPGVGLLHDVRAVLRPAMIRIENLRKSFSGVEVLKGASLEVQDGEVVALIGPSGDGKSVLLKHVAGLMQPDSGRIVFNGKDMGMLRGSELAEMRGHLGFLFQNGALFDSMTVYDNVAFPLREKTRLSEEEIQERVQDRLGRVGLEAAEEKYPAQLSGGMVRRAALARALVLSPDTMLFDEPTTGLDPMTVHSIHNLIAAMHEQMGFSGIVVSHEIPGVFAVVQKVAMLHEGVIQFVGTPEEILATDDPVVRSFMGPSMSPQGLRLPDREPAERNVIETTGVQHEREIQPRTARGNLHDRRRPLPGLSLD